MKRLRALFVLERDALELIYGPGERGELEGMAEVYAPPLTARGVAAEPGVLAEAEVIFSGWGGPCLDEAFLEAAPKLGAFFYGAGALGGVVTEAVWARGVRVTCAAAANARPVAEYTVAMIVLGLKQALPLARAVRETRTFPARDGAAGAYGSTVGLVSMGAAGRAVREMLRAYDVKVVVYDPFMSADEERALGVELVSLDEVFARADVVSVHTPLLPETVGLITGRHLAAMKSGGTFINTARGPVVREEEMIAVLGRRGDLQAVLDVAVEEPPASSSALYTLPNVLLTPHIAGSVGAECRRMGRCMVEEFGRYLRGEPLKWEVTAASVARTSHRPVQRARSHPWPAAASPL